MNNLTLERVAWAGVFILVGVLLLANQANLIETDVFETIIKLWPVFLIIPGIKALTNGQYFWGAALVIFGGLLIISQFTDFSLWGYIVPVFIIALGVSFLFKPSSWNSLSGKGTVSVDTINETALFGGVEKKLQSKNFKGGRIDATFGAVELDLRETSLSKEGAKLEVNAIFGGVEINTKPGEYNIITNGSGVFGGFSGASSDIDESKPTLEIRGIALFGAVEVK